MGYARPDRFRRQSHVRLRDTTAMTHAAPLTLLQKLVARAAGELPGPTPCTRRVPAAVYTDPARFAQEQARLFLQRPLLLGHASQIPEPGDAIVYDWLGLPLVTLRDREGGVNTFFNVCRHRGMRLVEAEGRTCLRSLVCPYHQWTYGLDGALRNVPRPESFSDLDTASLSLRPLPTELRHGLIWVQVDRDRPLDVATYLGGVDQDLEQFGTAGNSFFAQHVRGVDCNWKLIQDAFLDGYHVVRLHKKTVGPFFPDALAESDRVADHIRNAVARIEIEEAVGLPVDALDLRRHCTFSYTLFPNAVLIFHPDYTSIISLFPQGPDRTVFAHTMLTPQPPADDRERDHYQRSFELIDRGVFQAEDIFVSEGAQRGMASGANTELLFGGLEESAAWFHDTVERALA